jgi:hypothetical protein
MDHSFIPRIEVAVLIKFVHAYTSRMKNCFARLRQYEHRYFGNERTRLCSSALLFTGMSL